MKEFFKKIPSLAKVAFGVIIVFALIFVLMYKAPLSTSNIRDYNTVKDSIEAIDSCEIDSMIIDDVQRIKYNGEEYISQPVRYVMKIDSFNVHRIMFIKLKRGFLKYNFDGFYGVE